MRSLYMDCFCGVSGDMTVGALLSAGAPFTHVCDAVASLGLDGVSVGAEQVLKKGIRATQFRVIVDPDAPRPHRHLSHIVEIIQRADLEEVAKQGAIETFHILGAAEAEVHGTTVEKIHFHEVGAADSIVDIVAANVALHQLKVERIVVSPLTVGFGTVRCDHGIMPVPAPATALLLRDVPWKAGDVEAEMVTPTGAALVRRWAAHFGQMPSMKVTSIGYGAGTRELPDRANVLRVFLGETSDALLPARETIAVVETNIDDMNPELTALLIPALLDAGAKDAFITPVIGKKGRMAQCLTALCDRDGVDVVVRALFTHSGTLGIRMREEQRWTLQRESRCVRTPWGNVSVKVGLLDGTQHCVAPEFEACRTTAETQGVATRVVYEAAHAAAVKGEWLHE